MNAKEINHRESDYLLFQGLTTYLPAWEVVEKEELNSGSRMLVSHNHIKNGARVSSTISILEDFSFRIPFHREGHALLELMGEGLLRAKRIVKVHHYPVLIQEGYTALPPLEMVSLGRRIEWLKILADTFDRLCTANYALRCVSMKDVVFSPQNKVVFRTLGWLATYFAAEHWRSLLEVAWQGKEKRIDLISFLGIMAELFGFSLPKVEMDLEQCVAFMLEIDVPETIQSASDIAELVSLKILIKEEAEEDQSKEDDVDWSIDTLQVYHEQFSMVCIPEGCYADDQSATIIPNQMWISQHPISQALFALVLNQPYRSDQSPVTNISWWEAVRFCNALSTLHGKRRYYRFSGAEKVEVNVQSNGFRLPFAVEWNYSFSSSRTLLFQDCDSEWMQDRFCLNQEQLPKEQVHDVVALESISSRWYKRLICGSDREQESKEPKLCSASCGFRVVLHSPVKNLEKRT